MGTCRPEDQTVLVTGGSGFLGQHIVRLLQERDNRVKEIRILDLVPYVNKLGHKESKEFRSLVGNIVDRDAVVHDAFRGVDCVFHCAAAVSYEYPPDRECLEKNNVTGTENVIALCLEHNVPSMVFTSSAEVVLAPYIKGTFASLIINQTEKKAVPPADEGTLVFAEYAASKLRAEKLVLQADGRKLSDGTQSLRTIALRPTILYGEEDHLLIPSLINTCQLYDGHTLVRFAGGGGRQQHTYVGNAAWAHLRAKDLLLDEPSRAAGLPVFVTDDTPPQDLIRFTHRLCSASETTPRCSMSRWYVPALLAYFIAGIIEIFVSTFLRPRVTLPVSPRAAVSYLSSIVFLNRLRAAISLEYSPIFSPDESLVSAGEYYSREKFRKMAKARSGASVRRELTKEGRRILSFRWK